MQEIARQTGSEQVYRMELGNVNAYLVDDGDLTLVDAGTPGAADDIRRELGSVGYGVGDIDRILVTHFDPDHVGAIAHLDAAAPVYAMDPDASFLDGSRSPPLSNLHGFLHRITDFWITRPDRSVQQLEDGDTVGGFTAYHTPGHTPGHASYFHEESRLALVGDLVAEEDGALTTLPWFFAYSNKQNTKSVRAFAERDLPIESIAMGHGEPITSEGAAALDDLAGRLG